MGTHFFGRTGFSASFDEEKNTRGMDGAEQMEAQQMALGSSTAFEKIYNRHIYRLLDYASGIVGNRHDAEDLCANVFTNLWRDKERFGAVKDLESYLFICTRNACFNFLSSLQQRFSTNRVGLDELEHITADDTHSDIKSEYKELLRRKIERLPDQCRRIFKLAYLEGLKNEEIASQLKITDKTVRNQKVKALKWLRLHQELVTILAILIWILPF